MREWFDSRFTLAGAWVSFTKIFVCIEKIPPTHLDVPIRLTQKHGG